MQGGDYGAVVETDVDGVGLVHHCCCEDKVPEGGFDVADLEEEGPDWGFEVWG